MKSTHRLGLLATIACAALLSACSSPPVVAPEAPPAAPAAPVVQPPKPAPAPVVVAPIPAYLDPGSALYKQRSVFFDFDQSTIKPEGARVLELHGKFLAANPSVSIKVEGNTDEQGGREYNLALGQRRAEAVTKALKVYGVKDAQLEAVSFGKEKPRNTGHDEAARAENRRADLAYPAK